MDPSEPESEQRFRRMMAASATCILLAAGFFGGWLYLATQWAPRRGPSKEWVVLVPAGMLAALAYLFRRWAGAPLRDTWGRPTREAPARWRRRAIIGAIILVPWFAGVLYALWAYGGMTPGEVARMAASILLSGLAMGILVAFLNYRSQRPRR